MSKRILNVIFTPTFGGPHNQVLRLAPLLRQHGWEMITVLPPGSESAAERLTANGNPVVVARLGRPRRSLNLALHARFLADYWPSVLALQRLMRTYRIDIVQTSGVMNFQAALAARRMRIPVVWQLLSNFAPMPIRRVCMPAVLRLAHVLMTTGITIAHSHPGASRAGSRLIPFMPPVDTDEFRPDPDRRRQARNELGVPPDALLIGTVGNFCEQKAHELIIDVVGALRRDGRNVYCRIMGNPVPTSSRYYARQVRGRAEAMGLLTNSCVAFLSPGPRVAELLPALDVFVLSSRAEGVPTALLEALACGLPAVCTNVGAVSEALEDSVTGFLVPPNDGQALKRAVTRLLDQPELRVAFSNAARNRAVERFSLPTCLARHLQAYETAIGVGQPIIS